MQGIRTQLPAVLALGSSWHQLLLLLLGVGGLSLHISTRPTTVVLGRRNTQLPSFECRTPIRGVGEEIPKTVWDALGSGGALSRADVAPYSYIQVFK